jgi:hypothetical protein
MVWVVLAAVGVVFVAVLLIADRRIVSHQRGTGRSRKPRRHPGEGYVPPPPPAA